jgi:RING finger/CCCH-type zinc finger protein
LFLQLQTPESFASSIQELTIALQRSSDPAQLGRLREHFELLSGIDGAPGERKIEVCES